MTRILQSDLGDIFLRDLDKLGDDLYCSGVQDKENPHSPLVLVHPFYLYEFDFHRRLMLPFDRYTHCIEQLVKTNQGPIIFFEEKKSIPYTLPEFSRICEGKSFYVVTTNLSNPTPTHGWDEPVDFLRQLKGRPFRLVGGKLELDYWSVFRRHGACLGLTILNLLEADLPIEIIERATFI